MGKGCMKESQHYKTIITSEHKLLDLHLKETFQYRDLIVLFVRRDFTALYKQTILGPLWAIIQPLLTTIVFTVIFGNLAKLTTADIPGDFMIPGFLFYMAGNICWSYFSATVEATANTFVKNRNTMGKVYYPRLVSPIATALSKLIPFSIQFVLFMGIMIIFSLKGGMDIRLWLWNNHFLHDDKVQRSLLIGGVRLTALAICVTNCLWSAVDPAEIP